MLNNRYLNPNLIQGEQEVEQSFQLRHQYIDADLKKICDDGYYIKEETLNQIDMMREDTSSKQLFRIYQVMAYRKVNVLE